MFLKKIDPSVISHAKESVSVYAQKTYQWLKEGKFAVYFEYKPTMNLAYYYAFANDPVAALKAHISPRLAFAIDENGKILSSVGTQHLAFVYFLFERESAWDEATYNAFYASELSQSKLVEGLSSKEAEDKIEARKKFESFLEKLDKQKEEGPVSSSSKSGAKVSLSLEGDILRFEITVITSKKEYLIKDIYQF